MKITLLVLTISTLLASIYFTLNRWERPANQTKIVIATNTSREEITYAGNIRLSPDETTIETISAGGFIRYKTNNTELKIKSDKGSVLTYSVNGKQYVKGVKPGQVEVVKEAISEMIAYGFDAAGRLERLRSKGGAPAVLAAIGPLKNDAIKQLYIQQLISFGQLNDTARIQLIQQIAKLNASHERAELLVSFPADQLKDSTVLDQWLITVAGLVSAPEKKLALQHLLGENILPQQGFDRAMAIIVSLLADTEIVEMARLLMLKDVHTETQWLALIDLAATLTADQEKRRLLDLIAQQMPDNDNLIISWQNANSYLK